MVKRRWLDANTPGVQGIRIYIGDEDISKRCTGAELALTPKTKIHSLVSLIMIDEEGHWVADPSHKGRPATHTDFYENVWWAPESPAGNDIVKRLGTGKVIE